MKERCPRWMRLFLMGILSLSLISCGSNVFSGVSDSGSDPENLDRAQQVLDEISNINDTAQYQEVVDLVTQKADDTNAPVVDRQKALEIRGQARVGAEGIGALTFIKEIFKLDEGSNSSSQLRLSEINDDENVFEVFRDLLDGVSSSNLRSAADDLNLAAQIASQNQLEMSKSLHFFRGIINALVLDKMLLEFFTISDSEGVEIRQGVTDSIIVIMDSLLSSSNSYNSVTHYYREMNGGFTQSNALPKDVKHHVDQIGEAMSDVDSLYEEMGKTSGVYESYMVGSDVDPGDRKDNVLDAMESIFKAALN